MYNVGVGKDQVQSCEKQKVKEDSNKYFGRIVFYPRVNVNTQNSLL